MDYTEIISAVIALISALVSAFLIPWIKERVGADKLKKWQAYVEIAVKAAEQLYNANEGAEKRRMCCTTSPREASSLILIPWIK